MTDQSSTIRRRTVLVGGVSGLVSIAGCVGDLTGGSGQGPDTYELTIVRREQELAMRIEADGEERDVIRTHVGDMLTLEVTNDADEAVGVHNHANDEVFVLDPDGERTTAVEVGEEMTGRQEIEGWTVEGGSGGDGTVTPGEHDESATTLAVIEVRPGGG